MRQTDNSNVINQIQQNVLDEMNELMQSDHIILAFSIYPL